MSLQLRSHVKQLGVVISFVVLVPALMALMTVGLLEVFEPQIANAPTFTVQMISPQDYQVLFSEGQVQHTLIDVRPSGDYYAGHIEGAINIPWHRMDTWLEELPQDQAIVVYCQSGKRSAEAIDVLLAAGFTDLYNLGGVTAWTDAGMSLVN